MSDKIVEPSTQDNQTEPTDNNQQEKVNRPARPTSLHDIAGKKIISPVMSPISPNEAVNNNINQARPTSLHSGINGIKNNKNGTQQQLGLPLARPLSSTQSMRHKTKQSNSENYQQSVNFKRRQSLPNTPHSNSNKTLSTSSNSVNLKVPGSNIDQHPDEDFDQLSPRRYQYNGPAITPLLTPALSISSLVSSLDGSMENLNIQDGGDSSGENYFYFDNDKSPNDPTVSMATRKLHFTFEMANRDEIVNNRLKYFFNTLDTEAYYETHSGKDMSPTTPAQ